jgi:hypothetical protein
MAIRTKSYQNFSADFWKAGHRRLGLRALGLCSTCLLETRISDSLSFCLTHGDKGGHDERIAVGEMG